MRLLFQLVFSLLPIWLSGQVQDSLHYSIFEPGLISISGWSEGSPSITADGQTLLFTRFKSYGQQVPYIAQRDGDSWTVERFSPLDTVYNLAISPDGQQVFYKKRFADGSAQSYRMQRTKDDGWSAPQQLPGPLFQNAGYFRVAQDGTLYMYISNTAGNPRGIYYAEPQPDGSYAQPQWLSDAVSPYGSTTYTPIVNADETRLIVNRAGIVPGPVEDKLGQKGLRFHQKYNGQWDTGTRIEGIPYTYYAEVLPDGRLIFVHKGDLYEIDLMDTNIAMTAAGRKARILAELDSMEQAYAKGDLERVAQSYAPRGRIFAGGEEVARASYGIKKYWMESGLEPVNWELTSYLITDDPQAIYRSERWQALDRKPVKFEDLDYRLFEGGLYQFGQSALTYRRDGEEQTNTVHFLIYWNELWGETRIWVDSY